jgi:hypothetical protein
MENFLFVFLSCGQRFKGKTHFSLSYKDLDATLFTSYFSKLSYKCIKVSLCTVLQIYITNEWTASAGSNLQFKLYTFPRINFKGRGSNQSKGGARNIGCIAEDFS